jgi:Putative beta-barrel porin-2, OmpL-like. bbp2
MKVSLALVQSFVLVSTSGAWLGAARAEDAPPAAPATPATTAAAPAAPATPATPPAPKWYDTFEIHGLVDMYWAGNPDSHAQKEPNYWQTSAGPAYRLFDANNGFNLSYAKLTSQMAIEPVGFRLDLGFGQTATVLNGVTSKTPSGNLSSIGAFTVQQAIVSFKLPLDIVVDAGRFVTAAGAEVIEAKDNLLYSRSILFYNAIPFAHTGARATLPIKAVEGLSIMAGVVNGWDNPANSIGSFKDGILSVAYSGPSNTTASLNVIYGNINQDSSNQRLLLDLVLGRTFGDLTLSLNGDFAVENSQTYEGAALAARYALLDDHLRVAARVELFNDPDGLSLGVSSATYYEGTLGIGVPIGKNVELRAEVREDLSSVNFMHNKQSQFTGEIAALAWF